ncbi:acyl-CoA dehydrogenase family protein [Peptostreptococcus faecalis]|uniref:acyl-CoA dehydrogenase family protein n=1 Tax=Peptostreptococcus faecalis TaxID=2045015 RepID=UPI000C797C56|nr:acyl-CoA dehydrogenase family protein [Peptostreptococcus faecalis]
MEQIQKKAEQFAQDHIRPFAKATDEEVRFPVESFKQMGEEGYFKLMIPKELGGMGKGLEEHSVICREFAKESATAGLCYMMHNVALMTVLTYGSEDLKEEICKNIIENKVFMALAYSEFGTGTHFYKPEILAEYSGGKIKLNGIKSMVTSAEQAAYYLVLAPDETGVEGSINNLIIPADSNGVHFRMSAWNGLGMRGNVSAPMVFENTEIDSSYQIGPSGSGMEQVFNVVAPFFITGLASVYTGVLLKLSEESINHSINRVYPDGQALRDIETVQIHNAQIYSKAMAAKYMTQEAARSGANGEEDALAKILSARIFASEASIECARIAMRVGGGKAYNGAGSIERLLRDAYAGQIMAPSVDVLIVWLGKAVTGLQIP